MKILVFIYIVNVHANKFFKNYLINVFLTSFREYITHVETSTASYEILQNYIHTCAHGFLIHACCDTEPQFPRVHPKDPNYFNLSQWHGTFMESQAFDVLIFNYIYLKRRVPVT